MKYSLNPDVYITEINADGTRLGSLEQLTLDERRDYPFAWTEDNKTVLFASDRDGIFHVFKQRIDPIHSGTVDWGRRSGDGPAVGADNSTVLYVIWPKLGQATLESRLMAVPLSGGPPRLVLERSGMGNMQCARLPSTLCLYDAQPN